jgi:hypothetical protein
MKKIFNKSAIYNNEHDYYEHFGINPSTANLYGHRIFEIKHIDLQISDNQSIPPLNEKYEKADYWGWYDNEKEDFTMIWPQRFLLNMCFVYGIEASEKANEGKAYRLDLLTKEEE